MVETMEAPRMSLAIRLREARAAAGLTLDQLAAEAQVSKTYLWELEHDEDGEKKPSASVLVKIAHALNTTIADILNLPTVKVNDRSIDVSPTLVEFRRWMEGIGEPLTDEEFRDLATMRFRGGQPRAREDWHDLYRILNRTTRE